jgi:hypothetical protein
MNPYMKAGFKFNKSFQLVNAVKRVRVSATFDSLTSLKYFVEYVPEESTSPPMKSAVKARLATIMIELPKP